ncbi:glycosyltransferase family 32 protein [Chryseobacterium sp. CT-SW4]|uniref:glycosyltransferase family 32 protein n=1 Tax=Chryseobacterium sp. SW-1 TaxID=3157343 RepID=UPI003B0175A3
MPVPKQIFQTFKSKDLPWITQFHIWNMKRMNPEYKYFLYDDQDIEKFLKQEFPPEYIDTYEKLTIGAAKADFFRYAVLYKKGGVYLDIDSTTIKPLRQLIKEDDTAVISRERHEGLYVQWALIFEEKHPILKKVLELMIDNIQTHRYPNNIHATTGPTVFSEGVRHTLEETPEVKHRILEEVEYKGYLKFKYKLGKFFLYEKRSEHWKQKQMSQAIIK